MKKLKDSSEFQEAARLLGSILKHSAPQAVGRPYEEAAPAPPAGPSLGPEAVAELARIALEDEGLAGEEAEAAEEILTGEIITEEIAEAAPAIQMDAAEAAALEDDVMEVREAGIPIEGPIEEEEAAATFPQAGPTPSAVPAAAREAAGAYAKKPSYEAAEIYAEKPLYRSDLLVRTLENMCRRGGFNSAIITDPGGLAIAAYNVPVEADTTAAFTTVLGDALQKAALMLRQPAANNLSMDINYADKAVLRSFRVRNELFYIFIICPQGIDERGEIELSIEQIISILS